MYDGAVKIDTSLDPKGLDESMRKFKQVIEDGASIAQKSFSKVDEAVNLTARNSEKLNSSFKVDDESQREMIKTLDNLNAKIYVQQQQLSNLQAEYKRVASRQGENSDAALKLQKQILNTEGSIDGLIRKSDKLAASIDDGAQKSSSSIKGTGKVLNNVLSLFGINIDESVDKATAAFDEMEKEATEASGGASSALSGVGLAGAMMGSAVAGGATAAAGELLNLMQQAQDLRNEIEFSKDRITVALGLTAEEADRAATAIGNIYHEGLVESRDEAEEALTAVMRLMGAQGDEAESLANKIVGIKVAFGEDFATTARTASTMMQTFGIDGKTALDIITAGLQTSANKNNDLLDVLNEYSSAFKRMGYDGQEMLSQIVSATDAGAFSADKAADAFKEFYNRAAGADTSFLEALSQLGINGEDAMKKITSGGEIAKAEFELVADKLSKVTSESKQARIASQLFGSQWEDVGTKAVLALSDIDDSVIKTSGKTETAYKKLVESNATAAQRVENTWNDLWPKLLDGATFLFLLPLNQAFRALQKGIKEISESQRGGSTSTSGGYATGTASASPGWHLLGENGPEWGYFRGGEVVKTAAQSMAMMTNQMAGSAAFPMTSITNYNIKVDDIDTFNAIVNRVKFEQQYERMGYSGR